ncbi:hypothetical protein [Moraxella ovis]|uniref:hypothetical protein n=1 Tax=Moraxella ovis TaxID=29433 RepID=UPI0007BA1AC4|nr:hypothetical protein [Moraxella ovis]
MDDALGFIDGGDYRAGVLGVLGSFAVLGMDIRVDWAFGLFGIRDRLNEVYLIICTQLVGCCGGVFGVVGLCVDWDDEAEP